MAAPKIGGPVRPNTSNMPNTGPALERMKLSTSNVVHLCEFARLAYKVSAYSPDWSSSAAMLSGRMDCWSGNVDAAEAKIGKVGAEGASI